jgi:hypothetical protein
MPHLVPQLVSNWTNVKKIAVSASLPYTGIKESGLSTNTNIIIKKPDLDKQDKQKIHNQYDRDFEILMLCH